MFTDPARLPPYFNVSLAELIPYAASIQCPLGQVTGCFLTSNNQPATLTSAYSLLPGLLYSYKVAQSDLDFVAPFDVPEPWTWTLVSAGLVVMWMVRFRRRPNR